MYQQLNHDACFSEHNLTSDIIKVGQIEVLYRLFVCEYGIKRQVAFPEKQQKTPSHLLVETIVPQDFRDEVERAILAKYDDKLLLESVGFRES